MKLLKTSPFRTTEQFLVVELGDHRHKAIALGLDNEKNIFVRSVSYAPAAHVSASSFLKSLPLSLKRVLLLGVPATHAVTFPASVALSRERAKEGLGEKEFHELLSRAVSLLLNRYEPQASDRLSGHSGVALAHLRVLGVKVDGREVFDPIGVHAQQVEFELEVSFVTRKFAEEMRDALPAGCMPALFVESGIPLARQLARAFSLRVPFSFAHVASHNTELYRAYPEPRYMGAVSLPRIGLSGNISWGSAHLENVFTEALCVGEGTTQELVRRLADSHASPFALRGMHKIFSEGTNGFVSSAQPFLKEREVCYWRAREYALPEYTPARSNVSLQKVDYSALLLRYGFTVHASHHLSTIWQSAIPLFLDYYYTKEDASLERLSSSRNP